MKKNTEKRKKIRNRIKAILMEIGKTPQELADECGVMYGTLQNWIQGRSYPPLIKALQLSDVLDCSIPYLYYKEHERNSGQAKMLVYLRDLSMRIDGVAKEVIECKLDFERLLMQFQSY